MKHTRLCGGILFLTISAAGINTPAVHGQTGIAASVVGAGATEASGGGLTARGTVGQPVIGLVGSTTTENGQGFWFAPAESTSGVREEQVASNGRTLRLQCAPNPARSTLRLHIGIPENGMISLRLYDALGRDAITLIRGTRRKGESVVEADLHGLPPGYYTAELAAGPYRITERILVVE